MQEFGVATLGSLRGLLQQEGAGAQGEGNVLRLIGCARRGGNVLGGDSLSQIGAPGAEVIDPGLDGVEPVAKLVHDKGGGPEIVGESCQRRGVPLGFAGVPVQQSPGDVVVTIAEDCGGDRDGVAESSFCG